MTCNNLKQPTMRKQQFKTTYNDLKQPKMSKKLSYNNLKLPIKSKNIPKMTYSDKILRLFYNTGQSVLFSNTFSPKNLIAIIQALLHRKL